jgi:carboxymethylenebutenolidase
MPLQGNMIVIDSQEAKLPAYVSKPSNTNGKPPGIVIIHDWRGLGNFIKTVADRFASLGYVTIAPDLYLGAFANNPEEARKLSSGLGPESSKKFLDSVTVYLRALDIAKIGITGFCFGGSLAFSQVCESRDISAGVIYYATKIPSEEQLNKVTAPLLIIYGDKDQAVEPEEARQLEQKLKTLGKDAKLLMYPGAPHAFFNEENKESYRADAAKDSWQKTIEFFNGRLLQDWAS